MKSKRIGRRAGALLAGIAVGAALSLGTDMLLRAAGVFPPFGAPMGDALFALAASYRAVHNVLGSYVTARLAPDRPMAHALSLGALGVATTAAATVATWSKGPEFGPHWYALAVLLMTMPCAWAGGRLFVALEERRGDVVGGRRGSNV